MNERGLRIYTAMEHDNLLRNLITDLADYIICEDETAYDCCTDIIQKTSLDSLLVLLEEIDATYLTIRDVESKAFLAELYAHFRYE